MRRVGRWTLLGLRQGFARFASTVIVGCWAASLRKQDSTGKGRETVVLYRHIGRYRTYRTWSSKIWKLDGFCPRVSSLISRPLLYTGYMPIFFFKQHNNKSKLFRMNKAGKTTTTTTVAAGGSLQMPVYDSCRLFGLSSLQVSLSKEKQGRQQRSRKHRKWLIYQAKHGKW